MWERGLKFGTKQTIYTHPKVAPCVGAWIEIAGYHVYRIQYYVAPCVGAWIEIEDVSDSIVEDKGRSLCGSVD